MRENGNAPLARRSDNLPDAARRDPFMALRQEMDRLFDDFFAPGRLGQFNLPASPFHPALDLTESDKELVVRAELPGVSERDVEIRLDGDLLSIRGEKREERSEDGDKRRVVERSYGSFERSITLPFEPKGDVKAEFKDGVLTVRAARPDDAPFRSAKRIPIQRA